MATSTSGIIDKPLYRVDTAIIPSTGELRLVIIDDEDKLLVPACEWIDWLAGVGRAYGGHSPNTAKSYAPKVAVLLSWISQTKNWRDTTIGDIGMWRNTVTNTPAVRANGEKHFRTPGTVALYMTAAKSFFEWADRNKHMRSDLGQHLTQNKWYAAGTPAGGEYGRERRVLAEELTVPRLGKDAVPPKWIEAPKVRELLNDIDVKPFFRFLLDLLNGTGIRVGEALSLFREDMHLGGGSPELGCNIVDPHFHVRVGRVTENGAHSKGGPRAIFPGEDVIDSFVNYMMERDRILTDKELKLSQHVFVNLYNKKYRGLATKPSNVQKFFKRLSKKVGYDLTGPHLLRHTFATRLANGIDGQKIDIQVLQKVLGHVSLSSTQVYVHVEFERLKAATQQVSIRPVTIFGVDEFTPAKETQS